MTSANRFQMPMPDAEGQGQPGQPGQPGRHSESSSPPSALASLASLAALPREPFPKLVEGRELPCARCGVVCRYEASSRVGPGSPEFLRAHPDVWLAFVADPKTGTLEVVAACSEDCMQKIIRE